MSKAKDSQQIHPNVVAKLMGLEALSKGEINLSVEKGHRKYYSSQHLQMEDGFVDKEMLHEVFTSTEQNNVQNNGVHKTWLESLRTSHDEDFVDVAKMAFIQQKFMEAKVMSTDERLRNSKQFKDALEVLSSNSGLLIKLLDSHEYLYQLNSTPPAETKKRITLLKPLMVDSDKSVGKEKRKKKNDELIKKPEISNQAAAWSNKIKLGYSAGNQKVDEALVQSTRIVVLKPNSGKTQEDHDDDDDAVLKSRKVAKEMITQQVHETLYPSSVVSNYYSCDDETLFSKSYHGYKDGNFTDFDVMSQRHSLDHNINHDHYGSSSFYYSTLSLGGGTCSPESSVCIEAKRRLYERWTMMKSNTDMYPQQEQMHHHLVRRKSTTLGEMLSLFKIKKFVTTTEDEISTNEEEQEEKRNSVSCRHFIKQEMGIHDFHENHYADGGKSHGFSKVLTKSKSMSSLFRGKVSNFLFSRKKKSSTSTKSKDESQCSFTETSSHSQANSERVLKDDDLSQSFNSNGFQECSVPDLCESFGKTSSNSVSIRHKQPMINLEPGLESSIENQDQPSPISVLETPFEDDSHESLDCMKNDNHETLVSVKSNLIEKSPPIESIARTLSWGGSCADSSSSLDSKSEQQEWLILVEKLLSASGFHDDQVLQQQYDPFNNTRWHSLESPLDPSLRDKYANISENDDDDHHHDHHHLSESKRRKMRSNQKLVFDCVNAALLEFGPPEKYLIINKKGKVKSDGRGHIMLPSQQVQEGATCHLFLDHIVAKMKGLIMANGEGVKCDFGGDDCGDSNRLVVENVVRNEVVGINWIELIELEIDILVKEIQSELIQDTVEDAVVDFTCRA